MKMKYFHLGFTDMGQCWRNEMEMGDVREEVVRLYSEVEHLYKLLHAFVRHKLEKFYNLRFHNGLIPSHLLGIWRQFLFPLSFHLCLLSVSA